jgi:quinol monooxygenase YgiN
MAVIRINEFRAAPGQSGALRTFLAGVVAIIAGAPGCEEVQLLTGRDDADRLAVVERWASVDAHQAAATRISKEQMAAFHAAHRRAARRPVLRPRMIAARDRRAHALNDRRVTVDAIGCAIADLLPQDARSVYAADVPDVDATRRVLAAL